MAAWPDEAFNLLRNIVPITSEKKWPRLYRPNIFKNNYFLSEVSQVEVQEVFDLDDLHSDWHETFQAKKYYVWVPNPNKKSTKNPQDK